MNSQRTADIARYRMGIGQPIIASQQYDPGAVHSTQAARNARRAAIFHARWRGQAEPLLQIWEC